VLLDVRLKGSSGLDVCTEILRHQPDCKVVFLTVYDDEQYLYQALRVGAAGFLLKRIRGAELVDYLRRIADGAVLIDPALAELLSRVIETISAGLELDVILQGTAKLVTETTDTDVCFVHLLDERGRMLQLRGATSPLTRSPAVRTWRPSRWPGHRTWPAPRWTRRARQSPDCARRCLMI
jgi:CheY-like chemotaxis protein